MFRFAPALLVALLLPLLFAAPVGAMFLQPQQVPVDRLIANVTRHVEENPEDAHGHYTLARLHSLAVIHKSKIVEAYDYPPESGRLPNVDMPFFDEAEGETPTKEELETHLARSLEEFRRALELDPYQAKFHLGMAYTLEAGSPYVEVSPPAPKDAVALTDEETERLGLWIRDLAEGDAEAKKRAAEALRDFGPRAHPVLLGAWRAGDDGLQTELEGISKAWWREAAITSYRKAYDLAIEGDLKREHLPVAGVEELVAHEAGEAWIRLVEARGVRPDEKQHLGVIRTRVQALENKPMGAITPIVFPLRGEATLASLTPTGRTATFDLDGDGEARRWPWVSADAGILVWDPRKGHGITSGRQLFGSVTWWMFWRDGYEALAALDDDGNGWLEGDELVGLAVWRDRDGDATSDESEVFDVRAVGITAIAVKPDGRREGVPARGEGIRYADGRVVPTYDWTPTPLAPTP